MKIQLRNEIQMDGEMDVIVQEFEGKIKVKNGQTYLIYQNEEDEKVVLKLDEQELVMTRFSNPKSIMRFVKNEEAIVTLPTPVGLQHFVIVTHLFCLESIEQKLRLHYDLKPLSSDQLFASYKMLINWN